MVPDVRWRTTRRADHRFFRALSRASINKPEDVEWVFTALVDTLHALGFNLACVVSRDHELRISNIYGDGSLVSGMETFEWRPRRIHLSGGDTLLCLPVAFGYHPPISILFVYNPIEHRHRIQSVSSILRTLYFFVRCSGVEYVLRNKDRFIEQMWATRR